MWYKQQQQPQPQLQDKRHKDDKEVYATKLRFNGKMTPFGEVCPNHLSNTVRRAPRRQRGR